MGTEAVIVLVTTSGEEEAVRIGSLLVEERLAACCSMVRGVRSIYRWEGKVCDETECLMLIKTTRGRVSSLKDRVAAVHSYDVPEVLVLDVSGGLPPYLAWLEKSVQAIA